MKLHERYLISLVPIFVTCKIFSIQFRKYKPNLHFVFIKCQEGRKNKTTFQSRTRLYFTSFASPVSIRTFGGLSDEWRNIYAMCCAIWYHLHNLKYVKNTHGGVLLLVKLQALAPP